MQVYLSVPLFSQSAMQVFRAVHLPPKNPLALRCVSHIDFGHVLVMHEYLDVPLSSQSAMQVFRAAHLPPKNPLALRSGTSRASQGSSSSTERLRASVSQ